MRLMKFCLKLSQCKQESGKRWICFCQETVFFFILSAYDVARQLSFDWYCPSVSWTLLGMSKFQTRSCGVWTGTGGCWSDETTKRSIAWGGDCHNGKNGRVPLASRNLSMLKMLDDESGDCSVFLVRLKLKLHQKLDFLTVTKEHMIDFHPCFFGSQNLGSMKVLHLWVGKTTVLRILSNLT